MSSSLLLWCVLAVCVFWSVGLYNRLMRLRARGLSALGSVEKHMRVHVELVRHNLTGRAGVQVPKLDVQTPPDGWSSLLSALQVFEDALKHTTAEALRSGVLEHLGQSFDALKTAWHTLSEVPPDLAGPVVPATMRMQWDLVTQRVETARGGFNQIQIQYNEALGQFPARLVAGWMGFKPGGKL